MKASELLFGIAPDKDQDGKKKKKSAKRKKVDESFLPAEPVLYEFEPFAATVVDKIPCPRCGSTVTDLGQVVRINGKTVWNMVCGWDCGLLWTANPVEGVLEEQDEKKFVLREGRFVGKTFDEIAAAGYRRYIENLPSTTKRQSVAQAARDWLAKNG
jgi:hypothetical protein